MLPLFILQNKINTLHIFQGAMRNAKKVFKVAPVDGTGHSSLLVTMSHFKF